jgi:hypothetical protein
MRSSKDRTIEKKRRNKTTKVQKTEASRARRVSNKHKRQEIHDIDPSLKVFIMNEKTYDIHGTEIEVIDGKIKPVLINGIYKLTDKSADYDEAVIEYQEVLDNEAVIEKIETRNKSAFRRLTDKLRGD